MERKLTVEPRSIVVVGFPGFATLLCRHDFPFPRVGQAIVTADQSEQVQTGRLLA